MITKQTSYLDCLHASLMNVKLGVSEINLLFYPKNTNLEDNIVRSLSIYFFSCIELRTI